LNDDGRINSADFSLLSNKWGTNLSPAASAPLISGSAAPANLFAVRSDPDDHALFASLSD
jgi:hypothetical protein